MFQIVNDDLTQLMTTPDINAIQTNISLIMK